MVRCDALEEREVGMGMGMEEDLQSSIFTITIDGNGIK